MACCWTSRDQADHQSDFILDVERILQEYVWNDFKTSRSPLQKLCLHRKDFLVDVPMNYFHFDKIREEVRPRHKTLSTLPTASQRPPTLAQSMTHMGRDVTQNPLTSCSDVMALSTDFTNSTGEEQTYSFRFEKTRKASMTVTFQKGFTVGGKVNFSLGLPKTLADGKAGGEVDMKVTVSKATGEVIEETLTWSASSEIKVAKESNYTAKVLLSEVPVSYNFRVWTKMSMPSGGAPATVRHKKAGPGDSLFTKVIENLKLVFDGHKHVVEFLPEPLGDDCCTYSVVFKTTGIVDGVRLSDQKIVLDGKPIRRPSQGPFPAQGSSYSSGSYDHDNGNGGAMVMSTNCCMEDGYLGSSMVGGSNLRTGRILALAAASSQSPPPPPIIEEVPEDDGGGGVVGSGPPPPPSSSFSPSGFSFPVHGGGGGGGVVGGSHQVPRITTTSPSSLASSPLSDTGSPDSKKSQTVTTV
ncbi:hypothetical protein ACOMHN_061103 [Nucella lapillus]